MSGIISGAAAGAALGPIGAVVGGLLGAAPGLLEAFGVHLGNETTAGKIMAVVQAVTGKQEPTDADVAGLSPDQKVTLQVRLAEIDAQAEADDRRADLADLAAGLADVANARGQTVTLAQAGSKIAWGAPAVSIIVLAIYAVQVWMSFTHPEAPSAVQIGLIEVSKAGVLLVLGYWLGSSSSSRAKDDTILAQSQGKS